MSKLQPNKSALFALGLTFALSLCVFALTTTNAGAQSRRAPRPAATPTPEPTPTPEATQGESESKPRGTASTKPPGVIVSFLILENDNPMMSLDYTARDDIWKEFLGRLGKSRAVSLTQGGKATRGEALKRAKIERESYVVLFQMEEESEMTGQGSIGRTDTRTLLLKTFVYEPKTGSLKYADTIFQRPYRDTATIGGVRIPVPGTRGIERYPSQRQLQQAARDAADRLMSHFKVIPPPDNE